MNQRLLVKVLATMMAVILTMANFVTLGVYAQISYASQDNLENQITTVDEGNIEFDAYFEGSKGSKTHTILKDFDDKESKISLSLNVKKGYLKNTKVQITDENGNSANFKIINKEDSLTSVEKIDVQAGTIYLKQINAGTGIKLDVPFESIKEDIFDLSNFSKINNIKLIGTYVNNEGKTKQVEKTIKTRVEWKSQAKAIVEQNVKTYIPYEIGEKQGTILQTVLTTNLENNTLPIKETKIEIEVPKLNKVQPKQVIVTANTYATNNSAEEKFTKENYTYDEKTGKLNITVQNNAQENKVAWNKIKKDEYIVTYIYEEKQEAIVSEQKTKVAIDAYNNEQTQLKEEATLKIEEKGIKGNYITSEVKTTEELSKGYLYTKSEKEVEYSEEINTNIAYEEVMDKLTIKPEIDNFINNDGTISPTTVGDKNYAYYKTTQISKENFEKVLGTEGSLTIYGAKGEQIAVFNKDTKTDENGNYVYTYTEQTNQITIETTKPIANNTLKIKNTKSLKGITDYSKTQVQNFANMQIKVTTQASKDNNAISNVEATKEIQLVAPTTKVEAQVNKTNLSTVVKNENVEFRVILKTNDITCDLYKNPVVEIVLPNYIEELAIKDINLLYDNELKIADSKTYKNENGNTVIKITLKGEETKYNTDEITKGANIVINTDITVKQLTPTTDDTMKVYVTNENVTTYESANNNTARKTRAKVATQNEATSAYVETPLKAVAPVGIVTTNAIEGYNTKGETVTSISGEEKVGKLETKTQAKTATIKMNVINNYENKINNIAILGRIPAQGNKEVVTGKDLGSNLTTTLNGAISANGTVYYSENINATKDLNNASNGWSTNLTNNTKSYLIVLNDYEMNTGDTLNFSYGINIPENLPHNLSTYATYTVYYNNVKANETTQENVTATKVGLTTGIGPELEVKISKADAINEVEEGQDVNYKVSVKNTGKATAKNIIVKGNAVQREKASGETQQKIEQLEAGKTQELTFTLTAGIKTEDEETIKLATTLRADDLEKEITTESEAIKVTEGYLKLKFDTGSYEIESINREGQEFDYVLQISNVNNKVKENVVVTDVLPKGVTFVEANLDATYNEQTREVKWNLGTIEEQASKRLVLTVKIDNLEENETSKIIKNYMTIKTADKELKTEEITTTFSKAKLEVSQTSKTETNVGVGNTIVYNVKVKNTGAGTATSVKITDIVPTGLKVLQIQYSLNGKTYSTQSEKINIPNLDANQTIDISITMEALELDKGMSTREVVNKVTVSAKNIKETTSNEIKHIIVPQDKVESNDPSTEVEENHNKITGMVWLDENKDGKRDETEQKLSNIKVTLINAENGQIVKDANTGKNKEQTTNENGIYTFSNLVAGTYMVIFDYDVATYSLTTYHKDGVNQDQNSDAIAMNAKIGNETKKVGASDKITIAGDVSTNNIDMGLIVNAKFDLSLNKAITKITVQEAGQTKTHEFKDSKFAKVDLKDKTANGSSIVIEYKISVTNEGDIAGYAKKIVDYLPKDMKFSSELNSNWYQSTNGTLYNSELANTVIEPGQTKEVKLVLTKTINNDNLGLINNTAEIVEAYNDLGIEDIDSSTDNRVQDEDDMSYADAMIGIKTGEVYIYATITTLCAGILAIGIYLINKKVIKKM